MLNFVNLRISIDTTHVKPVNLSKEAMMSKEEENPPFDRRSGKDRRRKFNFSRFIYKGIDRSLERRGFKKRRSKSKKKQEDVDKGEGKETD